MTHDYKRHGTTTLFAALSVLDGTVIGRCMHPAVTRWLERHARFHMQFPAYSDVVGNADVQAATDASWASTKAATTPTARREEGFWIQIDTTAVTRYHTATVLGPVVDPTHTGSVHFGARPADNPATPDLRTGGVFAVASFHTHTPTTFRAVGRPVGPSAADNATDLHDDVTGVVYDYLESPAGSGSIPAGYRLNSPAQRTGRIAGRPRRHAGAAVAYCLLTLDLAVTAGAWKEEAVTAEPTSGKPLTQEDAVQRARGTPVGKVHIPKGRSGRRGADAGGLRSDLSHSAAAGNTRRRFPRADLD
jgi:hypothetical protein